MVREALAAIPWRVQIGTLSVTNGRITYCERTAPGASPGVLAFTSVQISVQGIANRAEAPSDIRILAQGGLMDAGLLTVQMTIPAGGPGLSFRYSGSLSPMDLTRLNAFLEPAEHTRIKSGAAGEVVFEIAVAAGEARGHVRGVYRDLVLAVLDRGTGA